MTDRDVYLKLSAVAEELMKLSQDAETYVGNAALNHAAAVVGGAAKAVYDHIMGGEGAH